MIAVVLWLAPGAAFAQAPATWSIDAKQQASLFPTDALKVGIPAALSAAQVASLAIEVDHVDVTALARIGDGKVVYSPAQPLTAGAHELRVVEYANDGRLVPRGAWQFTVVGADGHAAGGRGWSVKGNVGGTASERVAESGLTPPAPPRFTVNGTFDVKAVREAAEWRAELTVNGLYGTDNGTAALAGQAVQPGQIQFALRHHKDNLVVGDQTLPFDNLVISGLARRGISGHLADLPLGGDATAFSVRDSALAGFDGGLGVGDSNDIVSGALLESQPIRSSPKALTLQFGYVSGTSPGGLSAVTPYPGGNGSYPPPSPLGSVVNVQSGTGSAWVVDVASELPGSSVKLNAQYAGSSFDFPGNSGQAATHASDNAYSGALGFGLPLGYQWALTANLSYQEIGTFFTSLANPTLTPDRRTGTASATVSGHGLSLGLSDGYTQDNTDDNSSIATVRSLPRSVNLSYSPHVPASVSDWLGTPSVNLSRQDARTQNLTLPSGNQPTDSDVVNGNFGLNFAYPRVSWQVGVTDGTFRDYTGQQDNTDTFGPTFGVNLSLAGSGFVALNLQLVDAHDLKQDTHTLDHNYTLSGGDSFWDNRLSAQLSLAINHNTQQIVPGAIPPQPVANDVVLKIASAQLNWHAIQPTRTRGGLDVGLSGSWNESSGLNSSVLTSQGFSALATRGFQGFLTLSSKWPLEMGDR
jgi:hypothetical protein